MSDSIYKVYVIDGGIQIITEVLEEFKWKEPVVISMTKTQGISLFPMIQFADSSVKYVKAIDESKIFFSYEPNQKIIESYKNIIMKIQAQRSGIIV